jgi:hypothetical protein
MKIKLSNYGEMLISRPAGREAFLSVEAYLLSGLKENEPIEVDFDGVDVLAPSWADEFITSLKEKYGDRVKLLKSDNPSVIASLKFSGPL